MSYVPPGYPQAPPAPPTPAPGASRRGRTPTIVVLAIQSGITYLVALGALASGVRHIRKLAEPTQGHKLLAAAAILGVLATGVLASVIGTAIGKRWARAVGIVAECLIALVSLLSLTRSPLVGGVGAALAGLALFFLGRSGSAWDTPDTPGAPGYGAAAEQWSFQRPAPLPSGTPTTSDDTPGSERGSVVLAVVTTILVIGALALRSGLIFGIVVLAAIFIPMERLLSLHPQKVFRKNWKTDVVHFFVNNIFTTVGALLLAGGFLVAINHLVPVSFHRAVHSQPGWLQAIEAIFLADLAQYASHRASHQIPFLWRFHAVHHSIDQMDWLASARLHPLDQAFRQACIVVPVAVLGFSRATFGVTLLFTGFLAIYQHSNVRLRYGPLRWIIMNPQAHHWHHANEPGYYNKNFAGAFPVIDKIFGTAYIPAKQWPTRYGIDNPTPVGYLRQMAWPFRWNRYRSADASY